MLGALGVLGVLELELELEEEFGGVRSEFTRVADRSLESEEEEERDEESVDLASIAKKAMREAICCSFMGICWRVFRNDDVE